MYPLPKKPTTISPTSGVPTGPPTSVCSKAHSSGIDVGTRVAKCPTSRVPKAHPGAAEYTAD